VRNLLAVNLLDCKSTDQAAPATFERFPPSKLLEDLDKRGSRKIWLGNLGTFDLLVYSKQMYHDEIGLKQEHIPYL